MGIKIYTQPAQSFDSVTIREDVLKHGAVVFKNVFKIENVNFFLKKLDSVAGNLDDKPSKFIIDNPISLYRKINLGDYGTFGEFPRFFRTTYVPFWLNGLAFAENIFKNLIEIRNHISALPLDYALTPDYEKSVWSGCRVQQYFTGGGFFSEHTDIVVEKISDLKKICTIQLVALLTSKGKDFKDGGATIRLNEDLINIEDYASAGDVIAYDANSLHGVLPIDPDKVLDLSFNTGRIVALASVYKVI